MIILAIKLLSLFMLLWFGAVLLTSLFRGQATHWSNYAIPSAAAVLFAWTMGWLA